MERDLTLEAPLNLAISIAALSDQIRFILTHVAYRGNAKKRECSKGIVIDRKHFIKY